MKTLIKVSKKRFENLIKAVENNLPFIEPPNDSDHNGIRLIPDTWKAEKILDDIGIKSK